MNNNVKNNLEMRLTFFIIVSLFKKRFWNDEKF